MKKLFTISSILLICKMAFATSITFTFANGMITGASPTYYEFDVMAYADNDTTRLGDTQVYINYNILGFGSSINTNSKITVEKGTLLLGDFYETPVINDNTSSKVSIGLLYMLPGSPHLANLLPDTPTQLIHIKIEIYNSNETAGLSFDNGLMNGNQYESNNGTKYDPVIATDTDDSWLGTSNINQIISRVMPDKYKLNQNYPNPFNPSTTLKFDVPKNSDLLELAVYNILGKKVKTLYSGGVKAGNFSYKWDGKNSAGNIMPTGVYFAILKTKNFTQTIKMMLIK